MAQSRPDYSGIFEDGWLRKQKRNELREFIRGDTVYAIVEGPPGSLKTACVRQVAEELAYAVRECDVDGRYDDERSRAQALRLFNTDLADFGKGGGGCKVVNLVFNADLVKNLGSWILEGRTIEARQSKGKARSCRAGRSGKANPTA